MKPSFVFTAYRYKKYREQKDNLTEAVKNGIVSADLFADVILFDAR